MSCFTAAAQQSDVKDRVPTMLRCTFAPHTFREVSISPFILKPEELAGKELLIGGICATARAQASFPLLKNTALGKSSLRPAALHGEH